MKTILVCGGGGFIGHHLARRLKKEGHTVVVADIKRECEFANRDDFCTAYYPFDLSLRRSWEIISQEWTSFDEVYQLAADMGGAGYIFTGLNDANVMHNSALINLNCAEFATKWKSKVFYSSSACMYPAYNQEDPNNPNCKEDSAYPANPDSEYGWEKLFSERLYLAFSRNHGLNVKIARFHNIFGPEGTWEGGKEKAPAALCRKIIESKDNTIEMWGDGEQTRSFLYIDECVEGVLRLMASDKSGPVNIGSEEMVTINQLAQMIAGIESRPLTIKHIPGPLGVRGRNSDNRLIKELLDWAPSQKLIDGLIPTFNWIKSQVEKRT